MSTFGAIRGGHIRDLATGIRAHAVEHGPRAGIDLTEAAILLLCAAVEGRGGRPGQPTIGTPAEFAAMLRRLANTVEKDLA